MLPEIGSVHEGKVTGVTKFGAFVALEDGGSGLVHISEIANSFVSDVNQFVQVGQPVLVKVLKISDDGKINLSIKQAQAASPVEHASRPPRQERSFTPQPRQERFVQALPVREEPAAAPDADFEERLKKFMKDSDSRIADNKYYQDRGKRSRRR